MVDKYTKSTKTPEDDNYFGSSAKSTKTPAGGRQLLWEIYILLSQMSDGGIRLFRQLWAQRCSILWTQLQFHWNISAIFLYFILWLFWKVRRAIRCSTHDNDNRLWSGCLNLSQWFWWQRMDVFEVCVTHDDSVDDNVNGVVDQVVPQSGQLNSGHIAAEETWKTIWLKLNKILISFDAYKQTKLNDFYQIYCSTFCISFHPKTLTFRILLGLPPLVHQLTNVK